MKRDKDKIRTLQKKQQLRTEKCTLHKGCLSLATHCQLTIIGASSMLTRIPSLGCNGEGNFIQAKQLNCDTALCGKSRAMYQLNGDKAIWKVQGHRTSHL